MEKIEAEIEIKEKLRSWVFNQSKQELTFERLTDDTPIIETGLLSSLDIVEFIIYIERLMGCEIKLYDLEPEVFTNMNSIYSAFFQGH